MTYLFCNNAYVCCQISSLMNQIFSENKPVTSRDGSHTLYSSRFGEHYHSTFGAIQESNHIFIEAALNSIARGTKSINLFEVGFGTGLNALLAYRYAEQYQVKINYVSVEAFPLSDDTVKQLNYPSLFGIAPSLLRNMHSKKGSLIDISTFFKITVFEIPLQEHIFRDDYYDVVFFDAFSPEVQPEMWSEKVFKDIFESMSRGGVLTTYSCKGVVKRALKAAGFYIEKLPGPPGKREFIRAVVPS